MSIVDREAVTRPDLVLPGSQVRRVGKREVDAVGPTAVWKLLTREVERIAALYCGSPAGWTCTYVGGLAVITAYLTIAGVETPIATSTHADQRVAMLRLLGMLFEVV